MPQGLVDWRTAVAALRAARYDGWLNLPAEYNGRYASPVAAGGRTGATPACWKVDPTGNLTETPPALDLLQPENRLSRENRRRFLSGERDDARRGRERTVERGLAVTSSCDSGPIGLI